MGIQLTGTLSATCCNFIIAVFIFLVFPVTGYAGPLGLPDAARPGAVRPQPEAVPVPPTEPAGDIVDIPAVIDRPFDIEEGPFVVVKEFRLLDAEDYPEHGISIAEIRDTILARSKAEQPARGFSTGQLQEVADEVTQYYRSKGLILSTAFIPMQTVTAGVVDIQIFVGRLGRVIAEGNEDYSENMLRRPLLKLIGQPFTEQGINTALLTLTDYPGLSVFGVFEPGQKVGEVNVVLKVREEKWYDVAYRVDNQGKQETGRNRLRTTVSWNNPTGLADRLTATLQQTYNPKNNDYWALDYNVFLGYGFNMGLGRFKNRFDVGGKLANRQISAEVTNNSIYLEKSFIRSRQENLSSRLSLTQKVSRTRVAGRQTNIDRLSVLALQLDYDSVDTFHPFRLFLDKIIPENFGGGLNYMTVTYDRGFNDIFGAMGSSSEQLAGASGSRSSRTGYASNQAEGQFQKLTANYQRVQLMTKHTSFLLRTEFQWAKDILVPLEQYSVGGPNNVRGYPDAQGLFDRAYFVSLEYVFNAPFIAEKPVLGNRTWGELLQFSVFYDFATAQVNEPRADAVDRHKSGSWNTFKSVGMGLRFNVPGMINSRLMYATELGAEIPKDGRFGHIWGDFTYRF